MELYEMLTRKQTRTGEKLLGWGPGIKWLTKSIVKKEKNAFFSFTDLQQTDGLCTCRLTSMKRTRTTM